jgi:hypothetical protein
MKRIMLMHTVIVMCAILNIPDVSCQTTQDFAKTESKNADIIKQNDEVLSSGTISENMKDINIKAVREFIKKFGSKENVTWHKNDGGFVAEFMNDSVQTMVGYKDNGSWNYILKRYAEKKMSPDLRRAVKSTFFDYAIMEVTEITLPYAESDIIYRVLIKNEDNFKIVRICNSDMEIAANYTKP